MNTAQSLAKAEMVWEEHFKSCYPVKQVAALAISEVHWLPWEKPALHSKIRKGKWNACKKTVKEVFLLAKVNINNKIKETRLFWQTRIEKLSSHSPQIHYMAWVGIRSLQKLWCKEQPLCKSFKKLNLSLCFLQSRELYSAARQPVQSTVHSWRKQGDKSAFQNRSPVTWGLINLEEEDADLFSSRNLSDW